MLSFGSCFVEALNQFFIADLILQLGAFKPGDYY